jgi:hypothetical protein
VSKDVYFEFLIYVKHMKRYCDGEKMDLEILYDLQVLSSPE